MPVHKRMFLAVKSAEGWARVDGVGRAFAFEWQWRIAESFSEQRRTSWFGRLAVAAELSGQGYTGLRRANSTRLWATTADQMYALKWSSPRQVQRAAP